MSHDLLVALCLVLVIEGIFPFLSPRGWRKTLGAALSLSDHSLRLIGLLSMLIGTLLLYLVN